MVKKILVVEDDNAINQLLFDLLSDQYIVLQAYAGTEGKRIIETESLDLILLDLMLPGLSGEELISQIRRQSTVPIIVITAKAEVSVLADVLQSGANDYIAKPFNTLEVLARVETQLRNAVSIESKQKLSVGCISMDDEKREVFVKNQLLNLTQKEYEILKLFLMHPQKVFTKANLYKSVWQEEYFGDDNTISVHMSRLRNKLAQASQEELIETVWGVGFKMKS